MRRDIGKLVSDGLYRDALTLFSQHHSACIPLNKFTFPGLFKACGKLSVPLSGQTLQSHVIKSGVGTDIYTSTALIDMYMKTRQMISAAKAFDEMPHRNVASVNAMISGFSQNRKFREAMLVFRDMVGKTDFEPDSVTVASVLSGCELIEHGSQIQCWAIKLGVERDVYVATGILTMYMACGRLVSAKKVFEVIENKNVVSYNAVISGLLQNGIAFGVISTVFKEMLQLSSEVPNLVTFISILSACSEDSDLHFGRQIHDLVVKTGLQQDTKVGTALIAMYSNCGGCHFAYRVFSELKERRNLQSWNSMITGFMLDDECDIALHFFSSLLSDEEFSPDSVTWNAVISGFAQLGKSTEAFEFFKKMQLYGVAPTLKSLTSLLSVCSAISSLLLGKEIHAYSIRTDNKDDEFLATTLIDMYMKCGQFPSACRVFNQFEIKPSDPAFWNAMIFGCQRNGKDVYAFKIFEWMQRERVVPNSTTFLALLSACSHSGNAVEGLRMFRLMTRDYGLVPYPHHVGCMAALLGRLGQLEKASELLEEMPEPCASIFSSFQASGLQKDCELGEDTAKSLVTL